MFIAMRLACVGGQPWIPCILASEPAAGLRKGRGGGNHTRGKQGICRSHLPSDPASIVPEAGRQAERHAPPRIYWKPILERGRREPFPRAGRGAHTEGDIHISRRPWRQVLGVAAAKGRKARGGGRGKERAIAMQCLPGGSLTPVSDTDRLPTPSAGLPKGSSWPLRSREGGTAPHRTRTQEAPRPHTS